MPLPDPFARHAKPFRNLSKRHARLAEPFQQSVKTIGAIAVLEDSPPARINAWVWIRVRCRRSHRPRARHGKLRSPESQKPGKRMLPGSNHCWLKSAVSNQRKERAQNSRSGGFRTNMRAGSQTSPHACSETGAAMSRALDFVANLLGKPSFPASSVPHFLRATIPAPAELARRTGRFPQLVDSRSSVNGLLLTGSPGFREVSLEERRSLCRLWPQSSSWTVRGAVGLPLPGSRAASSGSLRRFETDKPRDGGERAGRARADRSAAQVRQNPCVDTRVLDHRHQRQPAATVLRETRAPHYSCPSSRMDCSC